MPVSIRLARENEVPQAIALARELFPKSDPQAGKGDVFFVAYSDSSSGRAASAAGAGNNLLGFAHLILKSDRVILRGIGVKPEYRQLGIGRQLLEQALAHAESAGKQKIVLQALPANQSAIHLYAKHGFVLQREGKVLTLAKQKPN